MFNTTLHICSASTEEILTLNEPMVCKMYFWGLDLKKQKKNMAWLERSSEVPAPYLTTFAVVTVTIPCIISAERQHISAGFLPK